MIVEADDHAIDTTAFRRALIVWGREHFRQPGRNAGAVSIIVVEIKGDEELQEPSQENRKKNQYAVAHFERINKHLEQGGDPVRYKFTFLTLTSFNKFFQSLRDDTILGFRSELDVKLAEEA